VEVGDQVQAIHDLILAPMWAEFGGPKPFRGLGQRI